jgi:hypothetical protein
LGEHVDSLRAFIDMSGGLNSDASTYAIKDPESPDLRNVRTDPLGPISGRYGAARANGAGGYGTPDGAGNFVGAALNKPLRSLFRYLKQNGSHLLLFTLENFLGKIASLSGNHDAVNIPYAAGAAGSAGLPVSDKNWSMVSFKDWVYLTTQDAVLHRTNGTNLYRAGEPPSEALAAVAVAGGALPIATYRYVRTRVFMDGLGESPVGAEVTATTAGANLQVQLTFPAAPRNDIIAYRAYRTLSTGAAGGPYYFVTQQAPSAVFTDNTADNLLGPRVDLLKVQPPKAAFVTEHHNRIWIGKLTEGSTPRYFEVMPSNAEKPDEFRSDVAYAIRNPDGEFVTGMVSDNGTLYITTMNHVFPIVGTGVERGPFINIPDYRVASGVKGPGAYNHRMIQKRNGAIFMLNKSDLWRISSGRAQPLSEYRLRKFLDANVARTLIDIGAAACTRDHYRATVARTGSTRADLTIIYDFQSDAFLVDDGYSVGAYAFLDGDTDNFLLYAGEATDKSYLYLMDTGNQDWDPAAVANKNIRRRWRSKDISIGAVSQTGQPRVLVIQGRQTGSRVALNLYANNNVATEPMGFLEFLQGSTIWGAFIWGQALWSTAGGGVQEHRVSVPQSLLGERLAWEFIQEENAEPFKIEMVTTTGRKESGIRGAGGAG